MTDGHPAVQHYILVDDNYAANWKDPVRNLGGGIQPEIAYGPYQMAPGDSIHIVMAEAVAGMSWEKACLVGSNWLQWWRNLPNPPALTMPDGTPTTDYSLYKRRWCETGLDSILKTYHNAVKNYNLKYNIPKAPPPPDQFTVTSGGDRIQLSWANNAESDPHFGGYVIYRSDSIVLDYRAVYKKIFECNKSNVIHSFYDTTAQHGLGYYYYIQSKDDSSQDATTLYSSMFWTVTSNAATLDQHHAGEFRSHQSGNWNDVNSWERFNGSIWVTSTHSPADTDGTITILSGHTITITDSASVDQCTISQGGALTIGSNAVLHVKDGDSTDLIVNGTLTNFGSISKSNSGTILFSNGSQYFHEQDGGSIPIATWVSGSTCEITGVIDTAPFNMNQIFNYLVWNCPSQNANFNIPNAPSGVLTILNTNWNHQSPGNPSHYLSFCNSNGNYSFNQLNIVGQNSAAVEQDGNYIDTIAWIGSVNITGGGLLLLSNSSSGTIVNNIGGSFTCPDSGYFGTANANSHSIVNFIGPQNVYDVPSLGFTYVGGLNFKIIKNANFVLGMSVISGIGSFSIDSGATIATSHPGGLDSVIKVTGTKSFSKGANYIFNSSEPQTTGTLISDTVGNLSINCKNELILSKNIVVNGTLNMPNVSLSLNGHTLKYGINSSLNYSGISPQTTTDAEFPSSGGPNNLLINNSMGVTLHASRSINGSLTINGGNLFLGANTLTAASATSADTNSYIVTNGTGTFKLALVGTSTQLFPIGTINGYTPIWITNSGTVDTIITHVSDDFGKAIGGGRVKAKWNINESIPGGGNYTIKFGWMRKQEDSIFYKTLPNSTWRIFNLVDTTQIASAGYARGTMAGGRTIQYAGITSLSTFTVGTFTSLTNVEESNTNIPAIYSLNQNYPNPFNPSTTISFGLPKKSFVTLKIYDLIGREIATIASEELSAGNYTRIWNASRFASGIYFCKLHAGSFTETKKLLLLK